MGLFDAVASIGNTLIDRGTAKRENRKARDFDREMAAYAYSKDLEMWEKSNEYNAPKQQMTRLEDAGLNPALMYGGGSTSTGNVSTSMPKYQDVKGTFGLPSSRMIGLDGINTFQDLRLKQAQIDSIKQLTKNAAIEERIKGWVESIKNAESEDWWQNRNFGKGYKNRLDYQAEQRDANIRLAESKILNEQAKAGWNQKKIDLFGQTGINIDKDSRWDRLISEQLGQNVSSLLDRARDYVFGKKK